ncbi:hypothetical protein SAMN05444161_6161 [Rhizobiales bacterium GAS191]|jgi:hypothetical protein|nr:hypothetical protein SAMN05519103_05340 [Rhizobiales bacterium GAS113]SEE55679.1 hypothetical protein SAMN05444161_6161 [Rhizobiales bacterium GAS191]
MNDAPGRDAKAAHVGAYKTILRNILDQRPSGTRQRLATALGKNRSFVSHISNPAYPVPIPAPHIEIIFEICHFSPVEKRSFLDAFMQAHPNRLKQVRSGPSLRTLKLEVFDFGNAEKNREFDELVRETARRLSRLMRRNE